MTFNTRGIVIALIFVPLVIRILRYIDDEKEKRKRKKYMSELRNAMISQSIADLENLIINSTPADGPMIKGILMVSLAGIDSYGARLDEFDKEKYDHINNVYEQLCAGQYNILPSHR